MSFALDPRLAETSHAVADLPLCQVRLQDDTRWPWLVLVPPIAGAVELEDLAPNDRARLMEEVVRAGAAVRAAGGGLGLPVNKLNVGALSNVVPQLHVHVVGRRRVGDPAGLRPVWGVGEAMGYAKADLERVVAAVRAALAGSPVSTASSQ